MSHYACTRTATRGRSAPQADPGRASVRTRRSLASIGDKLDDVSTNGPGGLHDPAYPVYRAAMMPPARPQDPWVQPQPVTAPRRQIDLSLILAALVMVLLAVGVVVGVAML